MEAVEAAAGAGLPAGGDVEPVGFFSRFSGSLKRHVTNESESCVQPDSRIHEDKHSPGVAVAVGAESDGSVLVGNPDAVKGVCPHHQEEVKHLRKRVYGISSLRIDNKEEHADQDQPEV